MNKFAKAGVAGVAALAIAAGGGTYALWSDYAVIDDNATSADRLSLSATEVNGFDDATRPLSPGERADFASTVTGRVGGGDITTARAYMTIQNVTDLENGCGSQTERDLDNCAADGDEGEFSDNAVFTLTRYNSSCATRTGTTPNQVIFKASDARTLGSLENQRVLLGDMKNGDQFCLVKALSLPGSTGNEVQTDSVDFDFKYDLVQVAGNTEAPAPSAPNRDL